ncbi:MAG: gliding motility-associated C-terminal domain-containing protein, partial [Flammeovirgaceae bacterium]|nr:gliding motility-associated C-terminal domain-containing protein [Flammeovirgaceae bacterium]
MNGKLFKKVLVLWGSMALVLLVPQVALATHLRAGNITVVQTGGLSVKVIVEIYVDLDSEVKVGGAGEYLDFGDGFRIEMPELIADDLGDDVGYVKFERSHTYNGPGSYIISWFEPNRNPNVINIFDSVNTTFYLETQFTISPFFGENRSPVLLIAPIDFACTGVAFQHNPGAYDPDGDSLSYELVIPYKGRFQEVDGYLDPNDQSFYNTIPYGQGNESGNDVPTFTINEKDGTLIWDAPGDVKNQGDVAEYNIAFIVREWKKIFGVWTPIGYVRRDMQIIVTDCDNERPDLIIPADTCIVAGDTLRAVITGIDPNDIPPHPVKIEAFSEILEPDAISPPIATFPAPASFNDPPVDVNFEWITDCAHVKDQPYQVVFKVTDNPGNDGPKLVTFKTWNITVVAPPPVWDTVVVNLANRSDTL